MMLRGLWKLTWIEIKVFLREPLGAFGTIGVPGPDFRGLGPSGQPQTRTAVARLPAALSAWSLPVLVSLLIAISAVLSLVTIISIYREGGILKRLRATPLRPQTILTAHVHRQAAAHRGNAGLDVPGRQALLSRPAPMFRWFSFTIALLISTWSILSIGFLIASIVPTARFAQPIGAVILYPMIAFSGLFVPVESLPPVLHAVARVLAADLRRAPAPGNLERRRVVGPHGRRSGAGRGVSAFARRSRRRFFAGSSKRRTKPFIPLLRLNKPIRIAVNESPIRPATRWGGRDSLMQTVAAEER